MQATVTDSEDNGKIALRLKQIDDLAARIAPYIVETPVHHWRGLQIESHVSAETDVILKLELFQRTGTFKARGALSNLMALSAAERERGVTAVSAGNHAIAVAYAASCFGVSAKVVMMKSANPARIRAAQSYGAEVLIAEDGPSAFDLVERIAKQEGRSFVHPFDGERTVLGTATVGREFARQTGALDAVIIPIGGGGLAAGISTAIKLTHPDCKIYGVEPIGAASMTKSFAAGKPVKADPVQTIADSLGPPYSLPYTYTLCRRNIDEIVTVSDQAMCAGMALLFSEMKLAVEPAGAATTAALLGPLRDRLEGKRVGLIVCGANIDIDSFADLIRRGEHADFDSKVH